MTLLKLILGVLLLWPKHSTDQAESDAAWRERMVLAATAIDDATARATCTNAWKTADCRPVWRGSRRQLAAALLTIGKHESGYAGYVARGACHEGPKGMRCDNGQARTYFQTWRVACPAAWSAEPGSRAELDAGAWCAARLLASAYNFCGEPGMTDSARWSGAFGRYAARGCSWSGGIERANTLEQVLQRFGRIRPEQVDPALTSSAWIF